MGIQILGKVGVTLKGEYNSSVNYEKLDIITYQGQSYVARTNVSGVVPTNTTYWQLIAEKGANGDTPEKGLDYFTAEDIAEVRNGLQTEITASNKVPSDFIDDANNTNKFVTSNEKNVWNNKSDFSGSYDDLTNKPIIPNEVTETTVSNWGFTKNTGTYSKPNGGIPKTDLTETVQTSLGKADTAIQSHQDISGKEDSSNKVTSISSASTDTQYPSAKCVYDLVGNIETLLGGI